MKKGSITVDMPFHSENEYSRFLRNSGAYLPDLTGSRLHILPLLSKSLPDPRMDCSLQQTYSYLLVSNFNYFSGQWRVLTTACNTQLTTDVALNMSFCIMLSLWAVYQVHSVIRGRVAQYELTRMWKDGLWNIWTIPAFTFRKRKERDIPQARSGGSRKFIFTFRVFEAGRFSTWMSTSNICTAPN
jgi:hypothetical protein